MVDVTDDEITQIATNFILSAPPGEFIDVVSDVRTLIPKAHLLNESAPHTFREYNTQQMIPVQSPHHQHQVLITKHGEVGENAYLDPIGNQIIFYDHIKQEVAGCRPMNGELDAEVEPYRVAFEQEALKYVQEYYPSGATTVYGKREGNGDFTIIVAIAATKLNPHNFYNGRWRTVWTISFSPADIQAVIKGLIQVNVHYYEEGNVQLNTKWEKQLQSNVGDAANSATNAFKAIMKAEQSFHNSLDVLYTSMGNTTFKALRRILPITVQKIDWNKIRAYKLGQDLKR